VSFTDKLREDYQALFNQQWPTWVGGMLIGVVNVFLFLFYQPWTTLDGALNWGDFILSRVGVLRADALSPLLRSGSVVNFGLLIGALASALLAGQFGIRVGPRRELAKGLIGGALLGVGAAIARGCNIGGFFSATSAFAASGLVMALGLAIGAFIGVRYLMWEAERATGAAGITQEVAGAAKQGRQPLFGLLVLIGLVVWAAVYAGTGLADRAVILLFGVLLGVVMQRSRVCFAQAFREPFLTGDTRHTRAMLLGLLVSIVGFALIKTVIFEKATEFVRPTFWSGALIGGMIFGLGMVLAGGCGGGTIWRCGEGHVKLWLALVGYVFSASLVRDFLVRSKLQEQLGAAVFLPDAWGWGVAFVVLVAVVAFWYLAAQWNEVTRKLAAL
jgi:hypothetical protein